MWPTLILISPTKKHKIRWWRTLIYRRPSRTNSEGLHTTLPTNTSARASAMVTSWGDITSSLGPCSALVVVVLDSPHFLELPAFSFLFSTHVLTRKFGRFHDILFRLATASGFNNVNLALLSLILLSCSFPVIVPVPSIEGACATGYVRAFLESHFRNKGTMYFSSSTHCRPHGLIYRHTRLCLCSPLCAIILATRKPEKVISMRSLINDSLLRRARLVAVRSYAER